MAQPNNGGTAPLPFGQATASRAVARRGDPSTSHAAAESLSEITLRQSQTDVLRVLRYFGPMTDERLLVAFDEFVSRFNLAAQSPSGIRTRRHELEDGGLVGDTGHREKLQSGRWAIVWKAVDRGR